MSSDASHPLAIAGYDPVAYFRLGKPAKGSEAFTYDWNGRHWLFASADHRDAFSADPQAFAPQNDGGCALAGALGKTGPDAPPGAPEIWSVRDGRLFLASNRVAQVLWRLLFAPKGRALRLAVLAVVVLVLIVAGSAAFGSVSLPTDGAPGTTIDGDHAWFGPVTADEGGIAIGGYDPVAYFTEGAATAGSSDWQAEWGGATWRFASDANRTAFLADPEAYAPQFGGHCAFAASLGIKTPGAPETWSIVDGRLFLNANGVAKGLWRALPGGGTLAYGNWKELRETP